MTLKERVLQYIKDCGSITSMEAFKELGVTRLSAIIYNLKQDGYNVKGQMMQHKNRYGDIVYFKKYWIEDK